MRKDYAKNKMTYQPRKPKKEPASVVVILVVFFSAFVLSSAGYWLYEHHGVKEGAMTWVQNVEALFKSKNAVLKTNPSSVQLKQENNVHFDFYTELPKMQVNHASAAPTKQIVTAPASPQYVIRLGIFKDQISASQLRLSLLLAGITADIIKLADHTYCVQQGPYTSKRQAEVMQRRVSKKGFDSEIKPVT